MSVILIQVDRRALVVVTRLYCLLLIVSMGRQGWFDRWDCGSPVTRCARRRSSIRDFETAPGLSSAAAEGMTSKRLVLRQNQHDRWEWQMGRWATGSSLGGGEVIHVVLEMFSSASVQRRVIASCLRQHTDWVQAG